MSRRNNHRGYTMLAVLAVITLIVSLCGLAYRELAATLRLEVARQARSECDEGTVHALARCLALLETGTPASNPYVRTVTIDTSAGPRTFTVTFTSAGAGQWSVQAASTSDHEILDPLPSTLATP